MNDTLWVVGVTYAHTHTHTFLSNGYKYSVSVSFDGQNRRRCAHGTAGL